MTAIAVRYLGEQAAKPRGVVRREHPDAESLLFPDAARALAQRRLLQGVLIRRIGRFKFLGSLQGSG